MNPYIMLVILLCMCVCVCITTTNLNFRGGCLPPPKVTFGDSFGLGGGLYKTSPNSIDAKSFEF